MVSLWTLVACSGAAILNATISSEGYRLERDVSYGENPRQKLDIYIPDTAAAGAPVVVFFYGGSWKMGDKDQYLFLGQSLASLGITTVIANYRLYPEVTYPAFIEDSVAALAYTQNHIQRFGGNPQNIFVMGHSAGAYNAVMAALDDDTLRKAGVDKKVIRGVIGVAGPYDFLPFGKDIAPIFAGTPEADTQPVNIVKTTQPPMLLVTGEDDTTVLPRNSQNLSAALRRVGSTVEEKSYPDTAHIGIVLSLAEGFRNKTSLREDIGAFIAQHSRAL